MSKFFFLSALAAAGLFSSAAMSQEFWAGNTSCTLTAPAVKGKPTISLVATVRTDEKGVAANTLQIRLQTDEVILADDEKAPNASISVPQQQDFSGLEATGSVRGKTNLIVIRIPPETRVLPAFSKGATAIVKIPAASGEKQLEVDLSGSGAAIKQIVDRCG